MAGGRKAADEETRRALVKAAEKAAAADRLYPQSAKPVEIDADVADDYWREIRKKPAK